ncbi:hypothetical protein D3C78_836020 [compost metagenome]
MNDFSLKVKKIIKCTALGAEAVILNATGQRFSLNYNLCTLHIEKFKGLKFIDIAVLLRKIRKPIFIHST